MTSQFIPHPVPDGIVEANGNRYMADGTGRLTAVENIPIQRKLCDELVRKEFGFAFALIDQILRFRGHVVTNLGQLDALLEQQYEVVRKGSKGNRSYTTFDGLFQIEVRCQDRIAYGPEMAVAKQLFDECLNEWAADTRGELRSIVTNAFDTDRAGQINRTHVYILLNTDSDDERWQRGQQAIRDAMYVIGSKEYVRFKTRRTAKSGWTTLSFNLAEA